MKPQWFPFYVADWRASRRVQAMRPLARWIYFELLCEQFDRPEHCLPADAAALAALTGLTLEEFLREWPQVQPCFTVRPDGRLENPRLKTECVGMATRLAHKSQHGRRAANARWDRQLALDLASADADAMHVHVHSTRQDSTHNRARARGPQAPHEYLQSCAHDPPCATVGLCGRRRELDQAVAAGAVTLDAAERLVRLWRQERPRPSVPVRARRGSS